MSIWTKSKEVVSGIFGKATQEPSQEQLQGIGGIGDPRQVAIAEAKTGDIFKAYIPNFLYKPPYGMPRKVNVTYLKNLAKNPYIFSVIKTLCDEATSVGWEIVVKEEFNEDGDKYEEDIQRVTDFFDDPNGNDQSFEHILRKLITDMYELDSGVIVKIFNLAGEFTQMYGRDGGTFLMNPDIYGYMGNKADYVPPLPSGFMSLPVNLSGTPTPGMQQLIQQYNALYREQAAYFQYGWTAGSMPVPFGKREIIYMMMNPRGDSIYGRSPIEVLEEVIMNLIYGVDYNLDFYTNNNMPEGAIQLMGAQPDQLKAFRENFENQFKFTDELGKKRKRFFKVPLSTTEIKFTQFQLNPADMDIIAQQQWFTKILWMCFGVTADEMGFTENSNRAVGEQQTKVFKRKAIKPLLHVIEYHLNSQLVPEFFTKAGEELADPKDVPVEFRFKTYDFEEDQEKHNILEQEIRMGIKTPIMVAKELGIDVDELVKEKEEEMKKQAEIDGQAGVPGGEDGNNFKKDGDKDSKGDDLAKEKEKAKRKGVAGNKALPGAEPQKKEEVKNPLGEIDDYIDGIGEQLQEAVDKIPENDLGTGS